jgi:pimeloyl-ACP methyl ester carboxylesterase
MSAPQMFQRPGAALALHDAGGTGVPFLFQHGLGGSAAQIAEVMPDLSGIRPITLECRGHGASEAGDPAAFSIATFADDVSALMAERHLGPAVVGGISMGAAIAARLAGRQPRTIRALVLARPAWVATPAPANMLFYGEVGTLLALHGGTEGRRRFLDSQTAAVLRAEAPDNLVSLLGFFERAPLPVTAELLTRIAADARTLPIPMLRARNWPRSFLAPVWSNSRRRARTKLPTFLNSRPPSRLF